ncbi:MAG: 4-alpha-glucanotransferase [Acidimicrobiales bacterium]
MNDDELRHSLFELARAVGVQTEYWDVRGQHRVASVEALLAVLPALGLPLGALGDVAAAWADLRHRQATRDLPPVLVATEGDALTLDLRLPEASTVDGCHLTLVLEDGGTVDLGAAHFDDRVGQLDDFNGERVLTRRLAFTGDWPVGYHTAVLDVPGHGVLERPVLVAPSTVAGPPADERAWGVFAPLHAVRHDTGAGPNVRDLDRLGRWIGEVGGSVVATLPLLAGYLDHPYDPSPYSPISRLFWNELYLDLTDLRETGDPAAARARLTAHGVSDELAELRSASVFPTRRQADLVRRVLGAAVAEAPATATLGDVGGDGGVGVGDLDDYARFRAAVAATGTGWHGWTAAQRGGDLSGIALDPDEIAYHRVAQAAMRRQLGDVAAALRARGQRLYLDLPVGVHADGYDTWREQDLFARGVSTGAPPDDFFTEGQDWGFPPIVPEASRAQGHRHWRDCLRHHMQVAGVLRLDHVMGLHRLFWVPDGHAAPDGVYVHYPREELLAVLAIESHRHDCWVVGEDLGTVPDEVREAMRHHDMLGMYVTEFRVPDWPGAAPEAPGHRVVASLDTHDTPTLAGFVQALDIERRVDAGRLDPVAADHERAVRHQQVANLAGYLTGAGLLAEAAAGGDRGAEPDAPALAAAATALLAESDSAVVLVTLEDLWGETEPQNVPGTPVDRPNWVHRFPATLAGLADDEVVTAALRRVDAARATARARLRPATLSEEHR